MSLVQFFGATVEPGIKGDPHQAQNDRYPNRRGKCSYKPERPSETTSIAPEQPRREYYKDRVTTQNRQAVLRALTAQQLGHAGLRD